MSGTARPTTTNTVEREGAASDGIRLGHVFGRSFEVLTRRFPAFVALVAIGFLPVVLTHVLVGGFDAKDAGLASFSANIVAGLVLAPITQAAVMFGVVQDMRGEAFSIGHALRVALRRVLPLIGVAFVTTFLMMLGAILLIVPGLMVLCACFVAQPVCLIEKQGVIGSIKRSAALTKGRRWTVFGVAAFVLVVSGLATLLTSYGLATLGFNDTTQKLTRDVWSVLAGTINHTLLAVLYVQLRTAREGLDLDGVARVFE